MADKEPTEAQVKEVWEWCGRKNVIFVDGLCMHDNSKGHRTWLNLDLNNLFKYAWVQAIDKLAKKKGIDTYFAKWSLIILWMEQWDIIKDPALALFWAIYQVFKENDNE